MAAVLREKRDGSSSFQVRAGETIGVDIRLNRPVVY